MSGDYHLSNEARLGILARHPGQCDICQRPIIPGRDRIMWRANRQAHVRCWEATHE